MKTLKIYFCIVALMLVPVLMDSCGSDCDCCGPFETKEFTIKDLFLSVSNTSATQPVPHSIAPKDLIFGFEMNVSYALRERTDSYKGTMGAYACDPVMPGSKQKFTALKITSESALQTSGKTFAAGDDLSNVFLLTDFNLNQSLHTNTFHFSPVFVMTTKAEHNFKFSFTLDDGQEFELQSGPYELIP